MSGFNHLAQSQPQEYWLQLDNKKSRFLFALAKLTRAEVIRDCQVFCSPKQHFRSRIEFRLMQRNHRLIYIMFDGINKNPVSIEQSDIVLPVIAQAMPILLDALNQSKVLGLGCIQVNFRANLKQELLITLVYGNKTGRKKTTKSILHPAWRDHAMHLQQRLNAHIIARFHHGKEWVGNDYLDVELALEHGLATSNANTIQLRQFDNTFSQPNPFIHQQMLNFARCCLSPTDADLLELYCGSAGFAIALSDRFKQILATEVVRDSLTLATHNCHANAIKNIHLARLSAAETAAALSGQRPFKRLQHIDLQTFRFSTVLVDPPRSGINSNDLTWLQQFEKILYFSCSLPTFSNNLKQLCQTHQIKHLAVFDQFPYTHHLEMAALLCKK